jgi:hypothetical protein
MKDEGREGTSPSTVEGGGGGQWEIAAGEYPRNWWARFPKACHALFANS